MLAQGTKGGGGARVAEGTGGGGWGVYFRSIELFKADRRGAALAGLLTLGRVPGEA